MLLFPVNWRVISASANMATLYHLAGYLMSDDTFTTEKRVLMAMRKTLGNIVKDVTPSSSALRSPLSDKTIEDIRMCFNLISARERDIASAAGKEVKDKPYFIDEPRTSNVVSLDGLRTTNNHFTKEKS